MLFEMNAGNVMKNDAVKDTKISLIRRLEQSTTIRAVRGGLTNMIPVLIIGAFALILKTFPVEKYQDLITGGANGFFLELFDMIFSATFGVLSLYMTYSISRSYMKIKADVDVVNGGAVFASLIAFFILSGSYLSAFDLENMGPKSMFLAIITGLFASSLYLRVSNFAQKRFRSNIFAGGDLNFNRMISTLLPIAVVTVTFALINMILKTLFDADSIRSLIARLFNDIFSIGNSEEVNAAIAEGKFVIPGFFKGFFFVVFSSILWFFGIHGSDTLQHVMDTYFTGGLAANQAGKATSVLTKEFFDCFVLMGGCGTTICLLISILIFSRNRARRNLGYAAAFPMIFNINELMVFGLPIVLNPIMLIPFLLTPLVCYSVSYFAISIGLVPLITNEVAWTTPIILGGYTATGSLAGSALQLFNVVLGVLIYLPFVRRLDRQSEENARLDFDNFMEFFRKNELELAGVSITERGDNFADFAKVLCAEIQHGNMSKQMMLYYQPQFNYDGQCIGVEALMRWNHSVHGILYPPLVLKLAEENGFLADLEEAIMVKVLQDRPKVLKAFGDDVKISVNVTGTTAITPRYLHFMRQLHEKNRLDNKNLCIEITEQAAIQFNEETIYILQELHDMGLLLAIDDFSMGQTSLHYLSDSLFDIIKLDGSLVREMFEHQNSKKIVSSVVALATSLGLTILAEYVETEEQREALHDIGCDIYQGYLFSPAIPLK